MARIGRRCYASGGVPYSGTHRPPVAFCREMAGGVDEKKEANWSLGYGSGPCGMLFDCHHGD